MNSLLGGSTVCLPSELSPTLKVIVQTLADVTLLDTFRSSVASQIMRNSELCINVFNRTCIHRGNTVEVQNPTQRMATGNSITATLLVCLQCGIGDLQFALCKIQCCRM